jgi:hypothetical protein
VSAFNGELRQCFEIVLGTAPPEPDCEPLVFFRGWLAERNLGLVPIANARKFDWPGHWIARVRADDGDHAIVMFGSPSGPLHDRTVHLRAAERSRRDGCSRGSTCGSRSNSLTDRIVASGSVVAILTAPGAERPLARVDRVDAVAGRGLAGDRYYNGRGTFSGPGRGYQLTLVEAEVLDSLDLPWEQARRNIVTRGIALNVLVGHRFKIGAVECIGRRLAEPCSHLEKLARPGLLRPLVHRGGLRTDILEGGPISIGDSVAIAE